MHKPDILIPFTIYEHKRPYNSMKAEGGMMPTEKEMEAYHRTNNKETEWQPNEWIHV